MGWRDALEALLVALFPPRCAACDTPLAVHPRFGLCDACFEVLELNLGPRCTRCDHPSDEDPCPSCVVRPPAFSRLRAPFVYGGTLAVLLVQAKFRGREDLAAAAGRLVATDPELQGLLARTAALIPIPLGAKRQRQRGYNQAAIVARALGRSSGVPVRHALRRVQNTSPQSDLPVQARLDNVRGAFRARRPISGVVAIVDDVVTSTETAREASRVLRDAGASEVIVLAVARAVVA